MLTLESSRACVEMSPRFAPGGRPIRLRRPSSRAGQVTQETGNEHQMSRLTPEQKARQKIDRMLEQSGWIIQNPDDMNISVAPGVVIREFPLKTGHADYMLYGEQKALGVVEAKPEGHTLTGVETQSLKYTTGLPDGLPYYHLPLPFAYESTGTVTQFSNWLEPDARSREVFSFHRPEELIRLAKLDRQFRANLRQMPPLDAGCLRRSRSTRSATWSGRWPRVSSGHSSRWPRDRARRSPPATSATG